MLTKRRRRSGVSSVIGAIFFVLVVFLVFSATVLVFQSFGNYSLLFKQVDQQDAQNRVTSVDLSAIDFGGLASSNSVPGSETLAAVQNDGASTRSLLPIANMNFSNSMSGWVFSRNYKIVRDDGYVTNTFLNIIPGETVFSLGVSNADASGTCAAQTSCITKVTLQVDSRFSLVGLPQGAQPAGWNAPTVAGNTITWTAVAGGGIPSASGPLLFNWTALAPGVPGSYFQTATLTWETVFHGVQINDEGSATVTTQVVTGGPGGVSVPNLCPSPATWNICAEPQGVIPGGAVGGYDPISAGVGSESGPGSVYLDFQPTYNGTTLTGGQQLTAIMNYTAAFTIDAGQADALAVAGSPDAVNFGYSLDQVIAPPNPLILIDAYLVQLTNTGTVNEMIQIPNTTPVVPTQVNDFSSSGWVTCGPGSTTCTEPYFNPNTLAVQQGYPGWTWNPAYCDVAGKPSCLYELVISVTASMPASSPPSVYYPSLLLMHFDDIGLSLQDVSGAYYVDNAMAGSACVNSSPPPATVPCGLLEIPVTAEPSEVQSITLTTNLALDPIANANVTAYVFLGDVSRGTPAPVWVEIGQLELSSSATISVSIPAASASNFIDTSGSICGAPGLCVRVYAISDGNKLGVNYDFTSLTVSSSAIVQTYQQNTVSLTLLNNSTFPVAFSNIYISGPDGVSSYYVTPVLQVSGNYLCEDFAGLATPAPSPCYVNQGQSQSFQLAFVWRTDQTYVVTVVTNKGLSISSTIVSP